MSENCDPLVNVMKNPEHESGYFEDGSDIEIISETINLEEEEIVVEEYTETCYGFIKDELADENLDEPVPDLNEDKSNKGKLIFSKEKYIHIYR
jgi:hypothetical protein